MITSEIITPIGKTTKTHGVKGEIYFDIDVHITDTIDYFILQIDGIYVPFFIEQLRHFTDTTGTVKLQRINNEQQAKRHTNCNIYIHNRYKDNIKPIENTQDELIGFQLLDTQGKHIGNIVDVDDSTNNPLLIITTPSQEERLIPLTEAYICHIDQAQKNIQVNLPDGLLDL